MTKPSSTQTTTSIEAALLTAAEEGSLQPRIQNDAHVLMSTMEFFTCLSAETCRCINRCIRAHIFIYNRNLYTHIYIYTCTYYTHVYTRVYIYIHTSICICRKSMKAPRKAPLWLLQRLRSQGRPPNRRTGFLDRSGASVPSQKF